MKRTHPVKTSDNAKRVQHPVGVVSKQSQNITSSQSENLLSIIKSSDESKKTSIVVKEDTQTDEQKLYFLQKRVEVVLPKITRMCNSQEVGQFFKDVVDTFETLPAKEQTCFRHVFGFDPQFSYERWVELSKPIRRNKEFRDRPARFAVEIFAKYPEKKVQLNDDLLPMLKKVRECFETQHAKVFVARLNEAALGLGKKRIETFGYVLGIEIRDLQGWVDVIRVF